MPPIWDGRHNRWLEDVAHQASLHDFGVHNEHGVVVRNVFPLPRVYCSFRFSKKHRNSLSTGPRMGESLGKCHGDANHSWSIGR